MSGSASGDYGHLVPNCDEIEVLIQECDDRLAEINQEKSKLKAEISHLQTQLNGLNKGAGAERSQLEKQKWQHVLAVRKCNQEISAIQSEKFNLLCTSAFGAEANELWKGTQEISNKVARCEKQLAELHEQKREADRKYAEQVQALEQERSFLKAIQESSDWKHALATLSVKPLGSNTEIVSRI